MCILIMKKLGVRYPAESVVLNSIKANPDGFSMAYNEDGQIRTFKTLDAGEFMDEYRRVTTAHDHRDTALMLHMRIATHGSVSEKNCHCWTEDILGDKVAFAHNGILRITAGKDMTDSETFLRNFLKPCENVSDFHDTIDSNIGASKFGFVNGQGYMMRFGHFIEERGVLYSNESYRRYTYAHMADPRMWKEVI